MRRILYSMLLVLAVVFNAQAYDFSAVSGGHTLYYNILSGTNVELAACEEGATGALVIPGTVSYNSTTYTVTTIGAKAFEWFSGLTGTLTIPNTVTTINASAFAGCTGFTGTLTLPASLTSIGDNAFYGCTGITGNLVLPAGLTALGQGAFYNCSGLTGDLVIPAGVNNVKAHAFRGCTGLNGTLTLPEGLTTIGNYAFRGCSSLNGELNLPSTLASIGVRAFHECSGFTGSIDLPAGLGSLGEGAFYGCSGLTGSLTIPSALTGIEANSFNGCVGLDGTVTLPPTIAVIKANAFYGCSSIASLVVMNTSTPPTTTENSFYGVPDNTPLLVFCGLIDAYNSAANWSRFTDVSEDYFFTVTAISHDETQGTVEIIEIPSCNNSCAFTVRAIPAENFAFEKWTRVGQSGNAGTNPIYQDTLKKDWGIEAHFKTKTESVIELSVYPEGSGTAEITSSNLAFGETIRVKAASTPGAGYVFERWVENGETVSTDSIYSFTSDGDRNLLARFHKTRPTISATVDPSGSAVITGTGTYNYGDEVVVTVAPWADYIFAYWTDEHGIFISTEPTLTFTADLDVNLVAHLYYFMDVDENDESISIFPNPTHDVLTINGVGIRSIAVNNTLGQVIVPETKQDAETLTIDLTNQPNGIYIVRIVTNNGAIIKKIVKE